MTKLLYPKYVLIMITVSLFTLMGLTAINMTGQIKELENQIRELEVNHMFSLDSRTYPGNRLENIQDELDRVYFEVFAQEYNDEDSYSRIDHNVDEWMFIAGRHNERLQILEYEVFTKPE